MKITDIQCIHIQIPKVSTNIIGGSVPTRESLS